jgi:CxxC-x17-CxxC domain-containing protein
MEEEVRDAVFGNVGTLAVFRVGAEDAEFLEREFTPQFTAEDLVNLPKYNIYLKLMIDGVAGHPFSAETLPPPVAPENSSRDKIIRASRERYGIKKEIVEDKILRWTGLDMNEEGPEVPKKSEKPANPRNPASQKSSNLGEQQKLYDAICSNCGKPTKVIFPPEKGRPVYCKSCLKKMRASGQKPEKPQSVSIAEPVKLENIPFHSPKRNAEKEKPFGTAQDRPKRKEINLSELRKALEESLEKKDEDEKKQEEKKSVRDADVGKDQPAILLEAPKDNKKIENGQKTEKNDNDKKRVINPGQTVKF